MERFNPPATFFVATSELERLESFCFDADTIRIIAELGFRSAYTNEQNLSWSDVNPLRTARFIGLDWGSGKFDRRPRYEWLP
jgi:hypothetical protein